MSETIRTVDLTDNTITTSRDVIVSIAPQAIDINQTDGTYAVVEPYDSNGGYNGRVVIYPQSPVSQIATSTVLKTFNRVGSLYYPLDAKFDSLRRKLWVADAGNDRVLKINLNTNQADLNIDEGMEYPHALAVDLNTGDIFIKAYENYSLNHGAVFYYKSNGTLISTFSFNNSDLNVSSSSSSFESFLSSSSGTPLPVLPSSRSIVFDHVRSRVWWVDNIRVYMADVRNKQIQTYDLRNEGLYIDTISVNVEFATGNALVVAENIHTYRFLIQVNRDNNRVLATAYVGV